MSAPRWVRALLGRAALPERVDEVLGDLEEVHGDRVARRGRGLAALLTALESLDVAVALLGERRDRRRSRGPARRAAWHDRLPGASMLDFKLGLRMLARHPSLTVVAVVAMAFGIGSGATAFQLVTAIVRPPLSWSDAARIVRLEYVSTETTQPVERLLHDYERWRRELRSVERLSAIQVGDRNLSLGEGAPAPVAAAAVSASAFDLVRVRPLLGRAIVAADEAPDAPAVAVLGHELWQERFAGDPTAIGRVVRLGDEWVTVVGVMPRDFALFPPQQDGLDAPAAQDLWLPFRLRALDAAPGTGPAIVVVGRLAAGATLDAARAELATVAARAAAEWPDSHARLAPRLLAFGAFGTVGGLAASGTIGLSAVFLALLMVVVCGNIALLLFARAAAREGEIAVRGALGASRGRIVGQLFAEALVLAGVAVVVGLAAASAGLRWAVHTLDEMMRAGGNRMPTWVGDSLSPSTVAYAALLAVVGAVVAGVLPGLRVTARSSLPTLQRLAGRSGARLGGIWTAVVVTQVALTVTLVPVAVVVGLQAREMRTVGQGLPPAEYLSVIVRMDGEADDEQFRLRFDEQQRALERRLEAEPGVKAVVVADLLPGSWHGWSAVEVERAGGAAPAPGAGGDGGVQVAQVDPDFFTVLQAPIVAGRAFGPADVGAVQRTVVVNESFVRERLGGRNALGQRLRYVDPAGREAPGPWHTIVGVSRDLAMTIDPTLPHNAGVYHPLQPGGAYPARMAVRVAGDPAAFTARLQELAAEAAPTLRLHRPLPLDQAAQAMLLAHDAWFRVVVLAGALALLLTNAGIYAVISFTVARRTREIGVRVALGASRRQVVAAVLARTARHVAAGVAIGAPLGAVLTFAMAEGSWQPSPLQGGGLFAAYAAVMMGVCLLACVGPMRRALGIEPTEALAAEG